MTAYDPPVLPTVPAPTTTYTYNDDHQLDLITRPDGQQIDPVYAASGGRLSDVAVPQGNYSLAYDTVGRLQSVMDPKGGSLSYAYDGIAMLAETWNGEINGVVSRTLYDDLRVSGEFVNGAFGVAVFYDADSYATQVGDETLIYDPITGHLVDTALGDMTMTITRNTLGEPEAVRYGYQGDLVYEASYARANAGHLVPFPRCGRFRG